MTAEEEKTKNDKKNEYYNSIVAARDIPESPNAMKLSPKDSSGSGGVDGEWGERVLLARQRKQQVMCVCVCVRERETLRQCLVFNYICPFGPQKGESDGRRTDNCLSSFVGHARFY